LKNLFDLILEYEPDIDHKFLRNAYLRSPEGFNSTDSANLRNVFALLRKLDPKVSIATLVDYSGPRKLDRLLTYKKYAFVAGPRRGLKWEISGKGTQRS
jgi:hypothetical protein